VSEASAVHTLALAKHYGQRVAVHDVSLTVRAEEIFGLLGPNGAGKSTFVKMLVGLIRPTAGQARLLGRPHDDPAVRAEVGYLPELFRYPPWLSAHEVLNFHRALLRLPAGTPRELDALLARVGLVDRGTQRVRTFSKGMQQRLGLAVALVGQPRVLFLDEPTSALDPLGRHQVHQLLTDLRREGVTVFLNSHLLADMESLADRVAVLNHGELLHVGAVTDAMREESRFRFTLDAPGAVVRRVLEPWLAPDGILPSVAGVQATVRVDRRDLPAVHRALVGAGVAVYEVEAVTTHLEEWFRSLVGDGASAPGAEAD
jgi:ABC-2 type transport system ATP-binding protein